MIKKLKKNWIALSNPHLQGHALILPKISEKLRLE
jgi:hypothetical protein